jgi:hypothetical protein
MVGAVEICDHEVDPIGAEVVLGAELHREHDLPERYRTLSGEDAPELCIVLLEVSRLDLRCGQAVLEQDVDGAAAINEHPIELDAADAGVEDKGEPTRFRDCHPAVLSAEGDLAMRPGRELGI